MAREAAPKSHAFRFTNPGSRWFDYHLRTPCFFPFFLFFFRFRVSESEGMNGSIII